MLERKVEAYLSKKQLSLENRGIVVGVSGGPDSLALLHFLWSARSRWHIKVIAAHLDHMFRGEESAQEAKFVQEFCKERNIPFEWKQVDVPLYMEQKGLSPEVAGRECRYDFFKEVLLKYQASLLALGHHGDDQVETILMRLTRGSTGKARAGIPFSRTFHEYQIFRPFLCLNREEIESYCTVHNLDPRRDPSNEEEIYSRNRFRKTVLPFLKRENPHVHDHFQRFSEELGSDEILLQELTVQKMNRVMKRKHNDQVTIDIKAFGLMPLPLQRRGIQLILNYLYQVRPSSLSALHIEQILSILNNPRPSGTLDFPEGLKVVRSYDECHFQFRIHFNTDPFSLDIKEPGEVLLPNGDKLKVEWYHEKGMDGLQEPLMSLLVNEEQLPLTIRTRKNGDRMTIRGMEGTKKLKDLFIDEKIPIHKRNAWPIVTNSSDQILWVPGLRKATIPQQKGHTSVGRNILLTYLQRSSRRNSQ